MPLLTYQISEQDYRYSLCTSRECSSFEAGKEHDGRIRKSRDWVIKVQRLTIYLLQELSKTVEDCERLFNYNMCFQDLPDRPKSRDRSLLAIQNTLDELQSLKKTLESLTEKCAHFARDVRFPLSYLHHLRSQHH